MKKVFVYGSLLSGLGNHPLLSNSTLLGVTKSPREFAMLDLGSFPGVVLDEEGEEMIGEVYEVDDTTMNRLDRLEGYNSNKPEMGLYSKKEIDTEFGKAFIYIYNNHYGRGDKVINGDWRTHYSKKFNR